MVDTLSLDGKVAIITGSGRETGIGAAIAAAFARNGAAVTINYWSEGSAPRAANVLKKIHDAGGRAISVRADVSTPEGAKRIVQETLKGFNTDKIDILVNNASAIYGRPLVMNATPADIDATFATAVRGPILLMQATVPHMPQYGRIVNVSSIASKLGFDGLALYAGGKAAMDAITFAIATELGRGGKNITVNTVAPGYTETDMSSPELMEEYGNRVIPLTRVEDRAGYPDDIADSILLLVSEKSRWVTGQYISVSGGVTGN